MVIDSDDNWIYESPDGGKTLYRRKPGEFDRELIYKEPKTLFDYGEFIDMIELSKSNPALMKALENLQIIYYTVKDERKNRT